MQQAEIFATQHAISEHIQQLREAKRKAEAANAPVVDSDVRHVCVRMCVRMCVSAMAYVRVRVALA